MPEVPFFQVGDEWQPLNKHQIQTELNTGR